MERWAESLIRASPFVRWTLSPCIILTMVIMAAVAVFAEKPNVSLFLIAAGIEVLLLCLLLSLWLSFKYALTAFRVVTLIVFVGYSAYLVTEIREGLPEAAPKSRAEAHLYNAIVGFVLIGLPCLVFSLFGGRFRKRSDGVME